MGREEGRERKEWIERMKGGFPRIMRISTGASDINSQIRTDRNMYLLMFEDR
jgi:hypothetical protein